MKYSQAIIVATIGSAALVSAAPTVGASQPETHHKKPAHRGSEKAHQLSHNLKQGASTALRTAGGAEGVATHLGNVVNLYRATKQFSNPEIRAVTEPATKVPAAPHHKKESSSTTSPSALKETEEQTAEAGAHHHHHKTDATHPRNKNKKIHHRIKETAGEVNPTHAKSAKAHLKTTPGETTPVSKVPTTPAAPVAVRDFLEAEDELQARLFDRFKQKYRELKAERLQKKADKAAAKAGGGEQPVYRDLLDEEEYLAARDFEEELEARGLIDAFKAAKHAIFHKHAPAVDASQDPNMVARSFLDEEDLFERDLYDLEDLEARGIRDAFKAAKHMIFHKHAPAAPAEDPSMVARDFLDEEDLFERGFDDFEDLEARAGGGIGKGIGRIFTKARNALKGHKTDIALTGASIGATVGSTVGVATRDLSEEEFDELIARGILGKVFSKVRNGLKGHKTDAAFTAVNVGSSMSGSSRRSFNDFEELEMRDFELNELD